MYISYNIKLGSLILWLVFFEQTFGQEKLVIDHLRKYELKQAELALQKIPVAQRGPFRWQINALQYFDFLEGKELITNKLEEQLSNNNLDIYQNFYRRINLGDYLFYRYPDKNIEALEQYRNALELAKANRNQVLACEALKKILTLHRIHYLYDNKTYKPYLEEYKNYAYDDYEMGFYHYFNLILNFKNYKVEAWDNNSFNWLTNYFTTHEAPYLKGLTFTVFASYFEELASFDQVWEYIDKAEAEFKKIPFAYANSRLNQLYVFGARIAAKTNNLSLLESYLSRFNNHNWTKIDQQIKALYYYYDSVKDTLNGDFKSAYNKYYQYEVIQDSVRQQKYDGMFNDLEMKYETAKKEKQILEEQQRAKINRNWLIVSGIAIFLGIIIAFLIYNNITNKRVIAEKEVELRQQKLETLLKNQELLSIDAMITGQEKERERVAAELHDELGSLMATIKLHLAQAQAGSDDEGLQNAKKLLDQAYAKIRGIAHAQNSGVMSDRGLLGAVLNLANTISQTGVVQVTVEHFGMGERLENLLELNLFRMVQELVTNAIKHAAASKISIQLTHHKDAINIIVEDNGKGFDRSQFKSDKTGIGLTNIEMKVEHLEGQFTIDSILGKGTSIIIDIPL